MSMQTMMRTADLELKGLEGERTARGVRSALKCIRGVAQVSLAPEQCHARVTYDAFKVLPHQFATAVSVMGCEIERLIISPELELLSGAISGATQDSDGVAKPESTRA
jgi:hypothetical protein